MVLFETPPRRKELWKKTSSTGRGNGARGSPAREEDVVQEDPHKKKKELAQKGRWKRTSWQRKGKGNNENSSTLEKEYGQAKREKFSSPGSFLPWSTSLRFRMGENNLLPRVLHHPLSHARLCLCKAVTVSLRGEVWGKEGADGETWTFAHSARRLHAYCQLSNCPVWLQPFVCSPFSIWCRSAKGQGRTHAMRSSWRGETLNDADNAVPRTRKLLWWPLQSQAIPVASRK